MQTVDVFISYKREEKERVELLAQKLKAVGLKVWFDDQLSAGGVFDEQIAAALKSARAILVCWTPGAIASSWVRGEAAFARGAGTLVTAFFEPTELIPPFNLVHAENLADWRGEDDHTGWAKILARVASMSGEPGLVEWAKMIGEGDPRTLQAWIDAQPAGPLRNTTRFWLSEMNSQPVFGQTGAPKAARPPSRGRGKVLGALALAGLLGVSGYFAMRTPKPVGPEKPAATSPATPSPSAITPATSSTAAIAPPAATKATAAPVAPEAKGGIVPPAPVAEIKIADGTIINAPVGSLVDLETGRVDSRGGPGDDFEVTFSSRYRWKSRGSAKMEWMPDREVPPNLRQHEELKERELATDGMFGVNGSRKQYQCFITSEGHRGFIKYVDGFEDSKTGVTFSVTFFR